MRPTPSIGMEKTIADKLVVALNIQADDADEAYAAQMGALTYANYLTDRARAADVIRMVGRMRRWAKARVANEIMQSDRFHVGLIGSTH